MSYQGIFLRHYMGQQPGTTGGTGWSSSPDIILYGQSPAPDPSIFTNQYDQDFGSTVYLNDYNNVYIRGCNTTTNTVESRLWLYYAESDLMLWPQNWRSDNILVAGNLQNYAGVTAAPGARIVTQIPLEWKASSLSGSASDHYSMIAIADNKPLNSEPVAPKPTQQFSSCEELAQYILENPNIAWRNTSDVAGFGATWQEVTPITGPDKGGPMNIGVVLKNIPTDCFFSLSVPGPDTNNSIVFPKTPVTNPNQNLSIMVNWPESFKSSMTISLWKGSAPIPPDAYIQPTIAVPFESLALRINEEALNSIKGSNLVDIHNTLLYSSPAREHAVTTKMIVVGAHTYRLNR